MAIREVITRGYGFENGVIFLPTRGYGQLGIEAEIGNVDITDSSAYTVTGTVSEVYTVTANDEDSVL